ALLSLVHDGEFEGPLKAAHDHGDPAALAFAVVPRGPGDRPRGYGRLTPARGALDPHRRTRRPSRWWVLRHVYPPSYGRRPRDGSPSPDHRQRP
ncbi:MAG: hypothetical protein ACRDS9_11005, partial [Pseudonocardiaceae bacterium]